MPKPGFGLGPIDPETITLTMRPPLGDSGGKLAPSSGISRLITFAWNLLRLAYSEFKLVSRPFELFTSLEAKCPPCPLYYLVSHFVV